MIRTFAATMFFAFAVGACATDASSVPEGNESLGIARFNVTETQSRTSLVALDAAGGEVGHLDLVHGTFTPMPQFAEDFDSTFVDGLSLEVDIAGESTRWQNAGYAPVLSLPAIPPSQMMLGQFLEDPHVAEILSRWQVGFEPFRGSVIESDESPYYTATLVASYSGTGGTGCSNCTSIGTVNSPARTINTCGGTAAAVQATKIKVGSEWMVLQTCYNSSTTMYELLRKSCPVSGNVSSCGTSTGACKGCPLVSQANAATSGTDEYVSTSFTTTLIQGFYNWQRDSCLHC